MKIKYTYEVVEEEVMEDKDLEEIASLLAHLIYQNYLRKGDNYEEKICHTF